MHKRIDNIVDEIMLGLHEEYQARDTASDGQAVTLISRGDLPMRPCRYQGVAVLERLRDTISLGQSFDILFFAIHNRCEIDSRQLEILHQLREVEARHLSKITKQWVLVLVSH
ncbi:MAG TPA: hypothetical protein VF396_19505 [Bradyrhizobium sp.]